MHYDDLIERSKSSLRAAVRDGNAVTRERLRKDRPRLLATLEALTKAGPVIDRFVERRQQRSFDAFLRGENTPPPFPGANAIPRIADAFTNQLRALEGKPPRTRREAALAVFAKESRKSKDGLLGRATARINTLAARKDFILEMVGRVVANTTGLTRAAPPPSSDPIMKELSNIPARKPGGKARRRGSPAPRGDVRIGDIDLGF